MTSCLQNQQKNLKTKHPRATTTELGVGSTHIASAILSRWSFPFAARETAISWQLEWKRRRVVKAGAVKGGDGSGGDSVWAAIVKGEGVRSTKQK